MEIQAQIPAALCAIHNFIRSYDPDEGDPPADHPNDDDSDEENRPLEREDGDPELDDTIVAVEEDDDERRQGSAMRDRIATAMWVHYQRIVLERSLDAIDLDLESDVDSTDEVEDVDEDQATYANF
jgi:hypothetical protein